MIQNLSGLTRNPNSIQYERSPAASAAGVLSPRQKLTPPKKSARILSIFVDKPVALYYNGQA